MYIIPIALYSFPLQFFKSMPLFYPIKVSRKNIMQSSSLNYQGFSYISQGIEVIAGLILIYLYLNKNSGRHQLRMASLSKHHVLNSLLDKQHSKKAKPYCLSLGNLTTKQQLKIKSSIVVGFFLYFTIFTKNLLLVSIQQTVFLITILFIQ